MWTSFVSRPAFPAGLHILLLDSNAVSRCAAATLLQQCSYTVSAAASPQEASQAVSTASTTFDLILADAATLDFRSVAPESPSSALLVVLRNARLPLLLMGSCPSEQDILAGMRAGAADFLDLPLSADKLDSIWQHVAHNPKPLADTSGSCDIDSSDPVFEDFGDFIDTFGPTFAAASPSHSPIRHEDFWAGSSIRISLDGSSNGCGSSGGSSFDHQRDHLHRATSVGSHVMTSGRAYVAPAPATLLPTPLSVRARLMVAPGVVAPDVPVPPTPAGVAPPPLMSLSPCAALSRSASTAAARSSGSFERARVASPGLTGGASCGASATPPSSCIGSKRKSVDFSSKCPAAGKAPPPPPAAAPPACASVLAPAAAAAWPTASMPMAPMGMAPMGMPMCPPGARPWPGMVALPAGQVWGQPMNPAAVAPGITPPIPNLTPMPPAPAMMPWGMPACPAPFPGFPGPPPMMGGHMMPFMHSMMATARPFMAGGFGSNSMMPPMMPQMMPFMAPPPQQQPPQQQPAVAVPAYVPSLAPPSVPANIAPPMSEPVVTPPAPLAAEALPLELIMPSFSSGDGHLPSCEELSSLHSSCVSSDEVDLFVPDFDLGGGKLRKINSTSFLPSLELLLWEDLDNDEEDELSAAGLSSGGLDSGLGGGLQLEDDLSFDCDLSLDDLKGMGSSSVDKAEADSSPVCPLGLKLKKSLSLADFIESSLGITLF